MSIQRFDGEVAEVGKFVTFPDFQIYDSIVFRQDDGGTLKLENAIGVPVEMADIFKPGLRGQFITYAVPLGRRGVFAVRPKGGAPRAVFKVPGEGMHLPMAIITLITVVFAIFSIWFFIQYVNTQKAKREGKADFEAG
jgi:hypothetical protein